MLERSSRWCGQETCTLGERQRSGIGTWQAYRSRTRPLGETLGASRERRLSTVQPTTESERHHGVPTTQEMRFRLAPRTLYIVFSAVVIQSEWLPTRRTGSRQSQSTPNAAPMEDYHLPLVNTGTPHIQYVRTEWRAVIVPGDPAVETREQECDEQHNVGSQRPNGPYSIHDAGNRVR